MKETIIRTEARSVVLEYTVPHKIVPIIRTSKFKMKMGVQTFN